jgi:hypothetical protein
MKNSKQSVSKDVTAEGQSPRGSQTLGNSNRDKGDHSYDLKMDQMKMLNNEGEQIPTLDAQKQEVEERGEGGFFLTGVNVTGKDVVDVEMPAPLLDE